MDHALEPMKATLCQSPLDQRRNVESLKLWIRETSYARSLPRPSPDASEPCG